MNSKTVQLHITICRKWKKSASGGISATGNRMCFSFTYLLTDDVHFSLASSSLTAASLRHSSTCLFTSTSFPSTDCKLLPQTGQRAIAASLEHSLSSSNSVWDRFESWPVNSNKANEGKLWSSSAEASQDDSNDMLLLSEQGRRNIDTIVPESSCRNCDILTPFTTQ